MWSVLVVASRVLPWAVFIGLWALLRPRAPYDGGDIAVFVAIGAATIVVFLLFHRVTDGTARRLRQRRAERSAGAR